MRVMVSGSGGRRVLVNRDRRLTSDAIRRLRPAGPNLAQAGGKKPGPGPCCGLERGMARRAHRPRANLASRPVLAKHSDIFFKSIHFQKLLILF